MRYGAGVLEWRVDKLEKLDKKTQKFLTMQKGLLPKWDVGRLCIRRKEGCRGLMSCGSTVRSEENNIG